MLAGMLTGFFRVAGSAILWRLRVTAVTFTLSVGPLSVFGRLRGARPFFRGVIS